MIIQNAVNNNINCSSIISESKTAWLWLYFLRLPATPIYIKQDCISVEDRPVVNVYLVMFV